MNLRALLGLSTLASFAVAGLRAAEIKHDLLILDEGIWNLLRVDQHDPSKNWIVHIDPKSPPEIKRPANWRAAPRDMQLIGGNRVLISHDAGYSEFDIATGKLLKEVASYTGVATARRLPNGNTLIAGANLDESKGVVVLEIDAANKVIHKTVFPGDYIRLLRETAQGTWLMMNNTMIREGDRDGKILHEWPVAGFRHAWKAVRLPNGHLLSSAGYGAFFVELDENGKEVRRFADKATMPAEMHANFYAMFQLLPNGDILFANWQNHGAGHGKEGIQMVQINPTEPTKLVWQWSEADKISSLQGVLVLDGLDTAVLHDERNGIMEPVAKK